MRIIHHCITSPAERGSAPGQTCPNVLGLPDGNRADVMLTATQDIRTEQA